MNVAEVRPNDVQIMKTEEYGRMLECTLKFKGLKFKPQEYYDTTIKLKILA